MNTLNDEIETKTINCCVVNILGEGVGDDVASGAVKNVKKKIKKPNGISFISIKFSSILGDGDGAGVVGTGVGAVANNTIKIYATNNATDNKQ